MDTRIRIEVDAAHSRFRMNQAGLAAALRGPVARDLVQRAIRVESAAKRNASEPHRGNNADEGRYTGSAVGAGPAVRTGRLRASITWRLGHDAFGAYADVGSAVLYAPYVELGTSRMAARPYLRPALDSARVI